MLCGLTLTLVVSLGPLHPAYHNPDLHIALETTAGLVSLLLASLMIVLFRAEGRLPDLVLGAGLLLSGLSDLAFSVFAVSTTADPALTTWSPLIGRTLGSAVICAAAFAPLRLVPRPTFALRTVVLAVIATLAATGLLLGLAAGSLPVAIDPTLAPPDSPWPALSGNTVVLCLQALSMLLYAGAALGFFVRWERTRQELIGWLSLGATLAAIARLNFLLFPSLYSDWVYVGDAFRFAFNLTLLIGVTREIGRYQRGLARLAVLEDRRRIARDLHDGLAHELAFIVASSGRLADEGNGDVARNVGRAAERALDEARGAVAALTDEIDEPVDMAVARAAEDIATRAGAQVSLDLENGIDATAEIRLTLVRVVREAVTNAVRHGNAAVVSVSLRNGEGLRLRVADDGVGFDVDAVEPSRGFGLTSMRERVESHGGHLHLTARPGAGTVIEVDLP